MFGGVGNENKDVAPIDMGAITQLASYEDVGGEFVTEIIDVFLADLGQRVGTIRALMSQVDRAGIAAAAHAIKGSCSHFGAARLIELSRHVEERARRAQEPAESLQAAIESMIGESERVRIALEEFRSSRTGP